MFMYTSCIRINMAKLYWRIKKNGKWTWEAFDSNNSHVDYKSSSGWSYSRTEEE